MPDMPLNLPASSTALSSSNPVGDVRAVSGELGQDTAAAFANLLKDSIKDTSGRDIPPELLADLLADAGTPDEDAQTLITSEELPAGMEAMAALLMAPAVQIAEAARGQGGNAIDADDALPDAVTGGGRPQTGAGQQTQAAGIAADSGKLAAEDGKALPDVNLGTEPSAESRADPAAGTLQHAQHADFRAHMQAAQARQTTELAVATPITQPGWADDVGHQITWLADQGVSKAELVLTPPHLGRIEITLEVGSDLSTAQFVSASPQVREALEQAMPRLREMLAQGGISLGEANVSSDQAPRDGRGGDPHHPRGREGGSEAGVAAAGRRQVGLVNLFA